MKRTILLSIVLIVVMCGTALAAPFAYIGHHWDGTVSVVDTATNMETAVVQIGAYPYGVAVNPAGTRVYVAKDHTNELAVIDTATNTVSATVALPSSDPIGVVVNPAGTRVYVSDGWGSFIAVVDTASNTTIAAIPAGSHPYGVIVNPAGTRLYSADVYSGTVSVVDTASNTVINSIAVGGSPYGVDMNPAGTRLYVTDPANQAVSVIDPATDSVIAVIPTGLASYGIAVNREGTKAYVTNLSMNSVSVIDLASNSVLSTIALASSPVGIALSPDGGKAYVTSNETGEVTIIDTTTDAVSGTFTLGSLSLNFGKFIGPAMTVRDSAAPVTTAAVSGMQGSNGWYRSDTQVTLTAVDEGAGVREIHYILDGVGNVAPVVVGSTTTFPVDGEGTHTLSYWAVDNAFNIGQVQTIEIRIDKTAPAATVSTSVDHLWPDDGKMVPVTINGTAQDTTSGVASVVVNIIDEYGDFTQTLTGFGNTVKLQERNSKSDPDHMRTYTITAVVTDAAGNQSTATTYIAVRP